VRAIKRSVVAPLVESQDAYNRDGAAVLHVKKTQVYENDVEDTSKSMIQSVWS